MNDYTGKTIYLGIDVHKKTYSVTAVLDNQVIKRDTLMANPERLVEYCRKYFPGAKIISAYEAGFSGFCLHRFLKSSGIDNKVVHPASIEVAARDRVKTDRRDSLKIATQLAAGRLKSIYIPSIQREEYRSITRLREVFLRHRNRIGCQLKSLLLQSGNVSYYQDQKCSKGWMESLLEQKETGQIWYSIKQYAKAWLEMHAKIKEIESIMKLQAQKDQDIEKIYRSVPGIGPVAARILANELGDMSQFSNEKKLFSYIGLTPCEYSSGEHKRQGHISRQGRSLLRKILIQVSWMAIKKDDYLALVFENICKRAGAKRAIVAVARRLIGRIRACFRTKQFYKEGHNVGDLVNISCEQTLHHVN